MSLQQVVLPSLLRGMVGMVTPGLRAVYVRVEESDAYVRFVYDHEPTEEDIEDVDDVETEMIADLHPQITPHLVTEFAPGTRPTARSGEIVAFMRKEPTP